MIQLRDKQLDDRELARRAAPAILARSLHLAATQRNAGDHQRPGRYRRGGWRRRRASGPGGFDGEGCPGDRRHADADRRVDAQHRAGAGGRAGWGQLSGCGPTFPSQTKSFDEFAGLDYLREVAAEIRCRRSPSAESRPTILPRCWRPASTRVAVGAAVTDGRRSGLRGA